MKLSSSPLRSQALTLSAQLVSKDEERNRYGILRNSNSIICATFPLPARASFRQRVRLRFDSISRVRRLSECVYSSLVSCHKNKTTFSGWRLSGACFSFYFEASGPGEPPAHFESSSPSPVANLLLLSIFFSGPRALHLIELLAVSGKHSQEQELMNWKLN